MPPTDQVEPFIKAWVWLFPASYPLHIAEEYLASPAFCRWVATVAGAPMTASAFLAANALFLAVMVLAVALVCRDAWPTWVIVGLGTIVVINAGLHTAGTLASGSYSPGLVSGLVIWLPLGT